MAFKGQKFNSYSDEIKREAVRLFLEEGLSYREVAKQLGVKSKTQIIQWVKKSTEGKVFDGRGSFSGPRRGRPKSKFKSIEEERDYLKAEVAYLKKRYPNLHGEGKFQK